MKRPDVERWLQNAGRALVVVPDGWVDLWPKDLHEACIYIKYLERIFDAAENLDISWIDGTAYVRADAVGALLDSFDKATGDAGDRKAPGVIESERKPFASAKDTPISPVAASTLQPERVMITPTPKAQYALEAAGMWPPKTDIVPKDMRTTMELLEAAGAAAVRDADECTTSDKAGRKASGSPGAAKVDERDEVFVETDTEARERRLEATRTTIGGSNPYVQGFLRGAEYGERYIEHQLSDRLTKTSAQAKELRAALQALVDALPLEGRFHNRAKRCPVCRGRSPVADPGRVHTDKCPLAAAVLRLEP